MKILYIVLISGCFILTNCGGQPNTIQTKNAETENVNAVAMEKAPTADQKEADCRICDFDFENYAGELNKEEVEGLLLALNDEYMARATYDRINQDFGNPRPFINIQQAEARHADRLKELFKTYKIPVPENAWVGRTPKFESVAAACQAGVEAEIANRDLYTKLFKSTSREDILTVYRDLQKASEENHLPAFQRCGGGGRGSG